ncbi:MAG: DMT family transporter [Eubacteriales bacterium]|nr:DMT family transporter [Eubacteriales bacterium]MDD4390614.1 DMT family transporter [Eubacteriales bacterium]
MQRKFAQLFIILAGCCWASSGIFVRELNDMGLYSMQIVEVRSIFTFAIFALLILIKDRGLFRIKLKDIWCFIGTGCLGIAFFNYCYYQTIQVSSLSVAAILLYTAPIFVMLISAPLFSEKLTKRKLVALAMAFAGCLLVSGILQGETLLTPEAFLVGILSGIGYALYTVFSKYTVEKGYNAITTTFYTFAFAIIACLIFSDSKQIVEVMYEGGTFAVAFMILFALISTVIPSLSYLTGMKYIEAGKVAVIASIEPVVATIFGFFVFAEKPTVLGFAGMILVVSAIIMLNLKIEEKGQDG